MRQTTDPEQPVTQPPSIVGGIVNLATGEIFARLVAFSGTALLTRRLGPEGFGIIGFATALCGYLTVAVNVGLGEIGAREVARNPHRARRLYAAVVSARLALAGVALLLLLGVSLVLPKPDTVRLVVFLTGLSFVSLALDASWVYKGLERSGVAAAGQLISQIVYVAGVALFVTTPADVIRVPVVLFIGEVFAAVGLGGLLLGWRWPVVHWDESRAILASAGHLSIARVSRIIIITFDVVFLGFTVSSTEVGWYAASYRVNFLLMAIAGAISTAYLPAFARAATVAPSSMGALTETAIGMSTLIGAPLAIGAVVTAAPLLHTLFGAAFEPAAPAFALLAVSMGFVFLHVILSNVLLASHDTKTLARIYLAAAAFTVVANLFAIPHYGIVGAASVSALAEGSIVVLSWLTIRRRGIRIRLLPLAAPVAAAALMGVVLWFWAPQMSLITQITLGGAVYVGLLGIFAAARWFYSRMRGH